ncbi:GNAT family N-acetyltransferase [Clostridium sp. HBUAS56010]|uniref:GNAT family N-acetyltransferase n=1 Tax=Clostridium sp. HBUAS56010 TaxID=2571127 RepID=UPI00117850D4|nr:GNAT family N-acetyltransferase [Clostridium sp. HBUAS56010]
MNHLGTVVLETDRLILRPFQQEDAKDMYNNWASSEAVTKYVTWPAHESMDQTEMILKIWVKNYVDPKCYQWCLEYKENGEAIGSMGVVGMDETIDAVEIGYCIGESYWHRGITTEALRAVVQFLFEKAECNRISARHDTKNPNSGKVMNKAGLQYEGTLVQAGKNNEGVCDLAVYGLTKAMYISRSHEDFVKETSENPLTRES